MSDHFITSLIEKLEGAEVGSRELDFRIWLALERDNTVVPQLPASFQSKRGDEFELYDADERCTGWVGFHVVPHYSLSIDSALELAERVLDHMQALALLHGVIDLVGSSGLPSNRIAPLFCAAISRATGEDSPANEGEG